MPTEPRKKSFYIWIGLLIVLGIGAGIAAPTLYSSFKRMRAHSFVGEAETLMGERKMVEAYRKIRAALQMDPNDSKALRIAAKAGASQNDPAAMRYFSSLIASKDATDVDRQDFVSYCIELNRPNLAEGVIKSLLSSSQPDARTLYLGAQMSAYSKDLPRSIQLARSSYAKDANNPAVRYFLGILLLESKSDTDRSEGSRLLLELGASSATNRLTALQRLIRVQTNAPTLQAVEAILAKSTTPVVEEFLLQQELALKRAGTDRAKVIAAAVSKYRSGTTNEITSLAVWLNRQGEGASVLKLVSPEQAASSSQLALAYLDATASEKKWDDAYKFVTREGLTFDPIFIECARASTARKMGKDDLSKIHLKKAYTIAGEAPEKILGVAEQADQMGAHEEALEGFKKLTANTTYAAAANRGILRALRAGSSTKALRDGVKQMAERSKFDVALQNYVTYLNVLLNEDLEANRKAAEQLFAQKPEDLGFVTTMGLVRLQDRQPASALELFGTNTVNYAGFPASCKAVYAAALGRANRSDEARTVVRTIKLEELRTEEIALIKPWIVPKP